MPTHHAKALKSHFRDVFGCGGREFGSLSRGVLGISDGNVDVSRSGAKGENSVGLAMVDLDEDGLADFAVAKHELDYVTVHYRIDRVA
ncbi:MAG: hypothetical protein OYK82_12875 [Gammaproteobacteria bacterium]|nr:hypothetical protein [Gammaproteobacteria bacterium]